MCGQIKPHNSLPLFSLMYYILKGAGENRLPAPVVSSLESYPAVCDT